VYPEHAYTSAGGLTAYRISDLIEPFRQAASYLPAQAPTKYDLAISAQGGKE
jgi:hypothetical protein